MSKKNEMPQSTDPGQPLLVPGQPVMFAAPGSVRPGSEASAGNSIANCENVAFGAAVTVPAAGFSAALAALFNAIGATVTGTLPVGLAAAGTVAPAVAGAAIAVGGIASAGAVAACCQHHGICTCGAQSVAADASNNQCSATTMLGGTAMLIGGCAAATAVGGAACGLSAAEIATATANTTIGTAIASGAIGCATGVVNCISADP